MANAIFSSVVRENTVDAINKRKNNKPKLAPGLYFPKPDANKKKIVWALNYKNYHVEKETQQNPYGAEVNET